MSSDMFKEAQERIKRDLAKWQKEINKEQEQKKPADKKTLLDLRGLL